MWDFEFVVVSHLRRPPRRPRLADLRDFRFILFRRGSRMQDSIDRCMAANGFEPNVIVRLDYSDLIEATVRAGLGISIPPYWVVEKDVKDGHLRLIHQKEPPPLSKLALLRRKQSFVPQPVQEFINAARNLDPGHLRLLTVPRP